MVEYVPELRLAYRVPEAAKVCGVCVTLLYEEIRGGRLRTFKIGTQQRIAGEDLLAWRNLYRGKAA